jgi:hypothetical protein
MTLDALHTKIVCQTTVLLLATVAPSDGQNEPICEGSVIPSTRSGDKCLRDHSRQCLTFENDAFPDTLLLFAAVRSPKSVMRPTLPTIAMGRSVPQMSTVSMMLVS